MKILKADHLGMCFGVRDAIALAIEKSATQPLTILGDLVHNEAVLAGLRARGIRIAQSPADVHTEQVMVTAHGASERAMQRTRSMGHTVSEATCPLVHFAHRAVRNLVRDGFYPVIVGKRDHVEVRGITGDLDDYAVVLDERDIDRLEPRTKFGVAAQTTQPIEKVRSLVARLRGRFPGAEVRFVDTVCRPTKDRQAAAVKLAQESDVVIVIGGAHSNNTKELKDTCGRFCSRVYHVQTSADLRREWFQGSDTVGITAGTSTPDDIIDGVERWLLERVEEARLALEHSEREDRAIGAAEHLQAA